MNRLDLQQLSDLRIGEAKALLAQGFPEGAYYLAGYSVECALKACIARRTREHDFPDKSTRPGNTMVDEAGQPGIGYFAILAA